MIFIKSYKNKVAENIFISNYNLEKTFKI